ncbi:hypothetical protein [Paenibacillus sp. MMS20-IR301]|uniref:hypothetical protein n=1 Tax=Paenibacillus sp. MMS20-IR301 TaxID=2895946 RepID=UPI0028E9A75B|nr:hypothetical protein [Paenibacillus sp. MMS20-IR301]WNS42137.1 hypothetical protein LOS79_24550 [Paenibacillus sp. MMS20-IR301]
MWQRIEDEAAGRKAGWTRDNVSDSSLLRSKQGKNLRMLILAGAAAVCLLLGPVLFMWTGTERAAHPPAGIGQTIGQETTLNGVTLTLGTVMAAPGFAGGDSLVQLYASLKLKGGLKYDQVVFAEETLTELSTGEQKILPRGGFKLAEEGSGLAKIYDINGLSMTAAEGEFRLSAKNLLLRGQKEASLGRIVQEEGSLPRTGLISVLSMKRTGDQLTVQYTSAAKDQQANNKLIIRVGNAVVKAGNTSTDDEGRHTDIFYLNGLTEDQIRKGELCYSYTETVRTITGDWVIDFKIDFAEASQPAELYALAPDPGLLTKSGIALEQLSLSPLQTEISYARKRPFDIEHPLGTVLRYSGVKLKVGGEVITGQQIDDADAGGTGGSFWFLRQYKDWRNQPITLELSGAVRLERDLSGNWARLPAAREEKQLVLLKLGNLDKIEYTVIQQGTELIVQTTVPKTISIMYGTVLRVDGKLVHPDPNRSWFSADYNRRTDYFAGIPLKAAIEINPGTYGISDPSGDAAVRLQ